MCCNYEKLSRNYDILLLGFTWNNYFKFFVMKEEVAKSWQWSVLWRRQKESLDIKIIVNILATKTVLQDCVAGISLKDVPVLLCVYLFGGSLNSFLFFRNGKVIPRFKLVYSRHKCYEQPVYVYSYCFQV